MRTTEAREEDREGVRGPTGPAGFLIMWGGQVVSLVGTSMTRFALLVWAWESTGAATAPALVLAFTVSAAVLVSPFAGVLVDRFERKRVMIASDLGAALTTVALLLLHAGGQLELWHIYFAAAAAGAFESFQFPAYSAAITLLVPKRHYARASGMISFAEMGSRIVGPPLAGFLLPRVGLATIFGLDLATFAFAVLLLTAVRIPAPAASEEGAARPGFWSQVDFGFRYILDRKGLLGLQLTLALTNFLVASGLVLRAPMILARSGNDELLLGQVLAAAGIGGVTGGVLLTVWGGPARRVGAILAGLALCAVSNIVLGLGDDPLAWAAATFMYPFFLTLVNGLNQAIWQAKVAPDVQGRVFSARRLIAQASLLPPMFLAGPLADHVFEPAMRPGGALEAWLAPWFGSGAGAGMAVLLALTGALGTLTVLTGGLSPPVREVEERLPDHRQAG